MKIKLLTQNAKVPVYSTVGSAACDLFSSINCLVKPHDVTLVETGISIEIPIGYVGLVCPRSGLASKSKITVVNSPGIVDSDYRGVIKVALINHSDVDYYVKEGDRIAQLMFTPIKLEMFEIVDELADTVRGTGGFGSTGQ